MMHVVAVVAALLATTLAVFALYLSYCTLRVAKESGKLATAPRIVQGVCYLLLAVAYALDVGFNIVIGTIAFLELPRTLTFTSRCSAHLDSPGYRGRLARWVCDGWLNPFEANHCR